jgi:copper chaperone
VRAVREELCRLDGVADVDVDLASGRVRIRSSAPLDDADVRAAVDEAGYEVGS